MPRSSKKDISTIGCIVERPLSAKDRQSALNEFFCAREILIKPLINAAMLWPSKYLLHADGSITVIEPEEIIKLREETRKILDCEFNTIINRYEHGKN